MLGTSWCSEHAVLALAFAIVVGNVSLALVDMIKAVAHEVTGELEATGKVQLSHVVFHKHCQCHPVQHHLLPVLFASDRMDEIRIIKLGIPGQGSAAKRCACRMLGVGPCLVRCLGPSICESRP